MKNNKIYCKFVSQVKSSQVKSSQVKASAKIVSLIALFILLFSISCKPKQNPDEPPEEPLIPKAYQGKYIGVGKNLYPKKDDVYNYNFYYETTSSNYIINSTYSSLSMYIFLKDANADYSPSINGKAILYYEDVDKPTREFYFFTNRDYKRILIAASTISLGAWDALIHSDDINK